MKYLRPTLSLMLFLMCLNVYALSTVQYSSIAGQRPGKCSGSFGQSGLISKQGFTDQELRKGIPCEMADFDSNGSNDFFFKECDLKQKCKMAVVLMKKNEIIMAIDLPTTELLILYPKVQGIAPVLPNLKKLGCQVPEVDALVTSEKPHKIFTMNKEKRGFEKFGECSPSSRINNT